MTDFERVYGGIGIHVDFPKTMGKYIILSMENSKNDYFIRKFQEQFKNDR